MSDNQNLPPTHHLPLEGGKQVGSGEYTPTTGNVRRYYEHTAMKTRHGRVVGNDEVNAEFDRWLEQERVTAWEEGLIVGLNGGHPDALHQHDQEIRNQTITEIARTLRNTAAMYDGYDMATYEGLQLAAPHVDSMIETEEGTQE